MACAGTHDPGELPEDVKNALQKAANYYEENLTIVTELGDRAAQGRAFGNLGNTHYLLGNFRSAVLAHEQVQQCEISPVAPDLIYMCFVAYSHELF